MRQPAVALSSPSVNVRRCALSTISPSASDADAAAPAATMRQPAVALSSPSAPGGQGTLSVICPSLCDTAGASHPATARQPALPVNSPSGYSAEAASPPAIARRDALCNVFASSSNANASVAASPATAAQGPFQNSNLSAAATADDEESILLSVQGIQGSRRFRFSKQLDLVLLRAAMTVGAHVPAWGKTKSFFEQAHKLFISTPEFKSLQSVARPSWKSLSDRFKKLVADRRLADKTNSAASGIAEIYGEREQILDDIIMQIDEKREGERAEREERSAKEKRLQEAGDEMRESALKRQRQNKRRSSPVGNSSESESDSEARLITRELETRKLAEDARRRLDEERLELEKRREVRELEHQRKMEEVEARRVKVEEKRVTLDERQFEVDLKERDESREERILVVGERKALIGVLGALAKKIQPDSEGG